MRETPVSLSVLYVSVQGVLGGSERVVLDLLRFHDRARIRPLLVVLRPGPLADEARALGVPCWVHHSGRFRNARETLRTVRFLRSIVRREGVDIVHGVMALGHLYGFLAAWGTGARVVWFQHDNPHRPSFLARLAAFVPSAMTFANSEDTAQWQRRLWNRTEEIRVIHNGVDLRRFCPAQSGRARLGLCIPAGGPVVGTAGRFERRKGHHIFLQAAARIRQRLPETVFLLAGDTLFGLQPEYKVELERLVLALGLEDAVRFLGFRNDMETTYPAMDVVVHASVSPEPFGLVIIEAMACGRPVVASDAGGPREIVVDGVTGYLTPPGDPEAIAERVVNLLKDPKKRVRMGQAGRRRVEELFGIEVMARRIEEAYLEILVDKFLDTRSQ